MIKNLTDLREYRHKKQQEHFQLFKDCQKNVALETFIGFIFIKTIESMVQLNDLKTRAQNDVEYTSIVNSIYTLNEIIRAFRLVALDIVTLDMKKIIDSFEKFSNDYEEQSFKQSNSSDNPEEH